MQRLGDTRLVAPLTLADGCSHRAAENAKEIRRHVVVPNLNGAVTNWPAVELFVDARTLVDCIQQDFRLERLLQVVRKVLLVVCVAVNVRELV